MLNTASSLRHANALPDVSPDVSPNARPAGMEPSGSSQPPQPHMLRQREWNTIPGMAFVAERFLELPPSLGLPPVREHGWVDPQGARCVRANATLLPLGAADRARATASTPPADGHGTAWSRTVSPAEVLQMQAPMQGNSRAIAGFGAALMAADISDLFAVAPARLGAVPLASADAAGGDAVIGAFVGAAEAAGATSGMEAVRLREGFNNKDNACVALLEGGRYDMPLPQDDEGGGLERPSVKSGRETASLAVRTREPMPVAAGLPHGEMVVEVADRGGRLMTHRLKTHWLDPDKPGWVRSLGVLLADRWHVAGHKPLRLALMCHDGASASGVVALALHGMQCLEDYNRGRLALDGPGDLARHMRQFIMQGWDERSPSFAAFDGRMPDLDAMAGEVWDTWTSLHSSPDTAAVLHRRGELPSRPASLALPGTQVEPPRQRPASRLSDDSGFLSPTHPAGPADASRAAAAPRPRLACDALLNQLGVSRAIHRAVQHLGATPTPSEPQAPGWFGDKAGKLMEVAASHLKVQDIMGRSIDIVELPALLGRLGEGLRPLLAQVVANGGADMRRQVADLAQRLADAPEESQRLHDKLTDIQEHWESLPMEGPLLKHSLALALLRVLEDGLPDVLPEPMSPQRGPEMPLAPRSRQSWALPVTGSQRRPRVLMPSESMDRAAVARMVSRGDAPSVIRPGGASPREALSPSLSMRSLASVMSQGRASRIDLALKYSEACAAAASAPRGEAAALDGVPRAVRDDWKTGGAGHASFLPQLDGLVKEVTASTGVRGFLRARMNPAITRSLAPHIGWGAEVAQRVRSHMAMAAPETPESHAAGAAMSHAAIRMLLQERFDALDARAKANWRRRVSGASDRFAEALRQSGEDLKTLPKRLDPSGSQLSDLQKEAVSTAPLIHLARKSPEEVRHEVGRAWGGHWVLSLMREVAGVAA